jgi:hydroxymethylbilane synthase
MSSQTTIRLGTRGSALARWQTDHVAARLREVHPGLQTEIVVLTTRGDQVLDVPLPQIGGKGLFTAELEDALRSGEIDLAVHSLKDLPTEDPAGLTIGAVLQRAAPNDVLVSRNNYTVSTLPQGATVGSSSHRRAGQLLQARPDLRMADIRGNVDTRIKKAHDPNGPYDAIILAQAGISRLGFHEAISEVISLDILLPAPGQGALAVQCRDDADSLALLKPLDHLPTRAAVTAERAFLAGLGGRCSVPVAAYGEPRGSELLLRGRVSSLNGAELVEVGMATYLLQGGEVQAAEKLGRHLAEMALADGAAALLEAAQ